MNDVTETLLEMHFHHALVKCFEATFGARFVRLLKPSTRMEAWVGFDQGWTRTSLANAELLESLRSTVATGGTTAPDFFVGYFMQFKAVQEMKRRSKYSPSSIAAPYYRAELSLEVNPTTGFSQHETLQRLAAIRGADVNYVCPMMFDVDELYDEPNLDQLQIVDVRSAPSGWSPTERHFIAFQTPTGASPRWCSEPSPAKALPARAWVESRESRPSQRTGLDIIHLIESINRVMQAQSAVVRPQVLPRAFTILQFRLGG